MCMLDGLDCILDGLDRQDEALSDGGTCTGCLSY